MKTNFLTPNLPLEKIPKSLRRILLAVFLILLFLPWFSFTVGRGQMTAIDPGERVQSITAPVSGFINQWFVKEGDRVKQGQLITEIVDNDPSLLQRLETEKKAAQEALTSAKLMMDTAKIDLDRQKKLFEQGLSSRKDYEKAKIEYSKLSVEYSKTIATLAKSETQFSRQSTQRILAPRDGFITRILPGERGQLIKAGSPIAIFTPDVTISAAEVWVDGNDASMILPGQTVRMQFEGWPALQIAGWPSVAIGTFKGKVHLIDQASSKEGKFRVLVVPDEEWPSQKFLRLGVQTKGYIHLNRTFVLREIWRILNGFPALDSPVKDELEGLLKAKNSDDSEDKK